MSCKDAVVTRGRYLTVLYAERLGDHMMDLNLDNYYVLSLIWYASNTDHILDTAKFGINQESQNEAFEAIEIILEQEGCNVIRKPKEPQKLVSPKRMEIVVEEYGGSHDKKRLVVTKAMLPDGHFSTYTVQGREWTADPNGLSDKIITVHSYLHRVKKIETFDGNGKCKSKYYTVTVSTQGWHQVGSFYKSLTDVERKVLEKWKPGPASAYSDLDDDNDFDSWPYSTDYNVCPSIYKPPVASFRVSGDEIGAKLYLEQAERLVDSGETLVSAAERILVKAEKKDEAEEGTKPAKTGTSSATFPGTGRSTGSRRCDVCHLFGCSEHYDLALEDFSGLEFGSDPRVIH